MEIAGRYLMGALSDLQPVNRKLPPQPMFGNFSPLLAPRPNRPPDPIMFVSPGMKGPGFF